MVIGAELKEIRWQGDSRKVAHRFPKGARNALGKELTRVQMGRQPRDGKWLTDIGPGVQEIRIPYDKEAYRVIYVARLAGLHLRSARLPQEGKEGHRNTEGRDRSREQALQRAGEIAAQELIRYEP